MKDVSPETLETLKALAWHRHIEFANLVVLVLGIAAETHPDEIRKALSNVFDLSSHEQSAKRVFALIERLRRQAKEVPALLHAIHQDIDRLEKRIDALNYELEKHNAG